MVATSPAVASLALAFGKYSTTTRRAFCTPQPSATSPPPEYADLARVGHQQPDDLLIRVFDQRGAPACRRQSTCFNVPVTLPPGFGPSHQGTALSRRLSGAVAELGLGLVQFGARLGSSGFSISRAFSSASRRFSASS